MNIQSFPAKVLHVPDFEDPSSIKEVTVVGTTDGYYKSETKDNFFFPAFIFPLSARDELIAVCLARQKLRKAYDDSASLIYQLRNKVARGEFE